MEDLKNEINNLTEELVSNSSKFNPKETVSEEPYLAQIKIFDESQATMKKTCLICFEDKPEIINCLNCELSVHLNCYGIKGDIQNWICEQCQILQIEARELVSCSLCNKSGGILRVNQEIDSEMK